NRQTLDRSSRVVPRRVRSGVKLSGFMICFGWTTAMATGRTGCDEWQRIYGISFFPKEQLSRESTNRILSHYDKGNVKSTTARRRGTTSSKNNGRPKSLNADAQQIKIRKDLNGFRILAFFSGRALIKTVARPTRILARL